MNENNASDLDEAVDVALGKAYQHYDYNLIVEPVEFVIDGFQTTGITVVAGQPGVGKTSLLVPLYLQVAGLGKPDDPLRPIIRRKVIYVTEDPRQVKQILVGMHAHGGITADTKEFQEWFVIKRARRLNPIDLQDVIRQYREQYTHEAINKYGEPYPVSPLIVLDTANATIDLQNENDNSEVGQVISKIKEALGDTTPMVIVTHLSKALNRANLDDVTPRGASAWSGDANAVQFVIKDSALENERFLVLGKRRFEAEFTEIRFETRCYFEDLDTPQGIAQRIPIRFAQAYKSSPSIRDSAKKEAETKARQSKAVELRQAILDQVAFKQQNGVACITKSSISRNLGVKKQTAIDTIDQMIEDGLLVEENLPPGVKPPSNRVKSTLRIATQKYLSYATRDEV